MSNEETIVLEDDESVIALKAAPGKTTDIVDTTLADGHAPKRHLMDELAETAEDLGGGFLMQDTPVLVQRGPTGEIARVTPLNEIPGVEYTTQGILMDGEPEEQEAVPTPAPLPRAERDKLVEILAIRLFKYYRAQGPQVQKYNPFFDGLPDLPAGSPEHLQPLPGTPLYPATDGQVYEWLKRFVAARVQVINRNRFGKDNIQDLAIHIE